MPRQISQCVSSWLLAGCNYTSFTGGIYWLCHITRICSFKITHFPAHFVLCKDTPGVQILCCLWSKDSTGECSVNVDGQACFNPDEVKSTVRWPRSHKWQSACFTRSEVSQSCLTLCNPMDCTLAGSSVHGIFQVTVLEWLAISFSRASSWPRFRTWVSHLAGSRFTLWATREALWVYRKFNYLTKAILEWKCRMSLLCFSGRWDAETTQVTQGEMTALGCQMPIPSA